MVSPGLHALEEVSYHTMMLKQPMGKVTWQGINTLYQHSREWGSQEADLQPSQVFS